MRLCRVRGLGERRAAAAIFAFMKPNQKQAQRNEGDQEKNESTATVELAIKKSGIDVNGEYAKRRDAQAILENGEWGDNSAKNDAPPGTREEHVARQHGGDQKRQRGANAAAFFRDPDRESRQLKHKSLLPKKRYVGDSEKNCRHAGAAGLEIVDSPGKKRLRNRNHKEKKHEREAGGPERAFTEKQSERSEPNQNDRKHQEREGIRGGEVQQIEARHNDQEHAGNDQRRAKHPAERQIGKNRLPAIVDQEQSYEWNQRDL